MATSKQQQLTRGWSLLGTVMPGFYYQRERPLESNQPFLTYYLFQNSFFFYKYFFFCLKQNVKTISPSDLNLARIQIKACKQNLPAKQTGMET